MSLYCFVYTSVSNQRLSDDKLKDLLTKSRLKNESLKITGMLLYLDPFFIQVLEGEEETVSESYKTIKEDPRHHKVSLIYKKPIAERIFPNWTMGFNKVSNENLESIEGFSAFWERPETSSLNEVTREIEKLLDMFKHETLF
jgi:hypothetical protein